MFKRVSSVFVVVAGAIAGTAAGDLVNPLEPSWAGDATATQYEWNSFTEAVGAPNFPDSPFSTGAQLFNFGEGAIIAGSGNIYNPAGGLNIHVYGNGPIGQAVLNFATQGTEFNYDNVRLFVSDGGANNETLFATGDERSRVPGGFGGENVTMAYSWDLDVAFEITEWGFFFGSDAAHSSLDAVRLNINSVPAPASLIALGAFGAVRRRRR